jgi:hypothetical protein
VLIDLVSETVGAMVVFTGFFAAFLRTLAVFRRSAEDEVEWMTAAGFAGGFAAATILLALDAVLG